MRIQSQQLDLVKEGFRAFAAADLRRLKRDTDSGRAAKAPRAVVEGKAEIAARRLLPGVRSILVAAAVAMATIALVLFLWSPLPAPRVVHTIQLTSDGQRKVPSLF